MKELPSHWHIDQDPVCRPEAVVKGGSWRITVLTPSLLRLEYSPDGFFEDKATQFALNRNFPPCSFKAEDRGGELLISTEALLLRYDKKPFSKNGLCVSHNGFNNNWEAPWHYGDNPKNMGGTIRTLDAVDGAIALSPGIFSRSGITVVDDSRTPVLEAGWFRPRPEGNIDIYVFVYRRNCRSGLKDFYRLCGPTPLLPRYALGNWWSRYNRYSEQTYMELIERFEKEKIPFSVSVIDMDWHLTAIDPALGSGWTGFTWNRELFPDPVRLLAWLHQKNLRVTLNLHPADGIRAHEEAYSRIAKRMGVDTASREAVEFDATNPDFLQAYFEEVLRPLEDEGVDFWWVDWQQGETGRVAGLDTLWILNHFHYLDSTHFSDSRRKKRALTFSRYAGLGSHRYPVGFSGDTIVSWASLDFQPYFTATASNAGYGWWSHDIGGHMGGARDDELTVRWVQLGVFSPINRLHSTANPFNGKEPWHFSLLARNVMTEFLRLRHRLVPYLYSMNRRASREGEPLIQPLYYAEPDKYEAYRVPNEYYFGSELLCCPLTVPMSRDAQAAGFRAWLPSGVWIDFFNGRIYSGGRKFEIWRGLEAMPVLAKAGGILPMANPETSTNSVDNPRALELCIFAGSNGSFILWEDQGDTPEDLDENWASTQLALDWDNRKFVVSPAKGNLACLPAERSWTLSFHGFAETGLKVSVGSREIPAAPLYDKGLNRMTLCVPQVPVTSEIRVEFDMAALAKNDVPEMLFDFLDKAWIKYEVKRQILNLVKNDISTASVLASLQLLDLPAPVYSCICEILCAFDENPHA